MLSPSGLRVFLSFALFVSSVVFLSTELRIKFQIPKFNDKFLWVICAWFALGVVNVTVMVVTALESLSSYESFRGPRPVKKKGSASFFPPAWRKGWKLRRIHRGTLTHDLMRNGPVIISEDIDELARNTGIVNGRLVRKSKSTSVMAILIFCSAWLFILGWGIVDKPKRHIELWANLLRWTAEFLILWLNGLQLILNIHPSNMIRGFHDWEVDSPASYIALAIIATTDVETWIEVNRRNGYPNVRQYGTQYILPNMNVRLFKCLGRVEPLEVISVGHFRVVSSTTEDAAPTVTDVEGDWAITGDAY